MRVIIESDVSENSTERQKNLRQEQKRLLS